MKKLIFIILALAAIAAHAETPLNGEIYAVDGHNFTSKAQAIQYVVRLGKPVEILHTRCEIMTNKFTFKACPKNKLVNTENAQFQGLK